MSGLRFSDIPLKAYFSFSFPIYRLRNATLSRPKDWADRYWCLSRRDGR